MNQLYVTPFQLPTQVGFSILWLDPGKYVEEKTKKDYYKGHFTPT